MLTTGSYNDGKRGFSGWTKELEKQFLLTAEKLNKNKNRFMISYVLQHGGKNNREVKQWIKKNNYNLIDLKRNIGYISNRKEILITNYK